MKLSARNDAPADEEQQEVDVGAAAHEDDGDDYLNSRLTEARRSTPIVLLIQFGGDQSDHCVKICPATWCERVQAKDGWWRFGRDAAGDGVPRIRLLASSVSLRPPSMSHHMRRS